MRSTHSRSHRMKVDMCKLEHSLFSLSVSFVPLTCHVLIFCVLNPPFPFHVSSHQRGSDRTSLSFAKPLSAFSYPVTLLSVHQSPSPFHRHDHIIQGLNTLCHLLPAVRPQGLFSACWIKFRGLTAVLGALQPGSLCLPLNVNTLYVNRHGNTPGLI